MREIIPEHEKELMRLCEPYWIVGKDGFELREDAPEEVKKANEELHRIGEERRKSRYNPYDF